MSRRVLTTSVAFTWPPTRTAEVWPVTHILHKVEVSAGSALETAVGAGNMRAVADAVRAAMAN